MPGFQPKCKAIGSQVNEIDVQKQEFSYNYLLMHRHGLHFRNAM